MGCAKAPSALSHAEVKIRAACCKVVRSAGVYSMRGHYLRYLKGLPGIKEFRERLMTLKEPEAIMAVLDDILVRYDGYALERTPIELVNYHENCPL